VEKIGVDVIRWMYFRQNPSDNLLFGYKKSDEIRRKFYIILWNVYKFFIDYANLENFIPKEIKNFSPSNILDKWILSRFSETIFGVEKKLRDFDSKNASVFIEDFVNDLSLWYIRRSRDRVWVNSEIERDKLDFYFICHFIIKNLAVILSPVLPFLSEEIYTNLCKDTSVHLAVWPEINKKYFDRSLNKDMTYIREMVEKVHSQRKSLSIPLRQPLNKLTITTNYKFNRDYKSSLIILLKKELNVKEIVMKTGKKESVILDTKLSEDLKNEGEARKIIRQIQSERKKLKTKLNQFIDVEIKDYPEEYEKEIKRRCLIRNLKKGGNIKVTPL
jgi:isoleucyl-tRNA synthetase